MKLAVIGISHKQLSLDKRSIFSFTDTQKLEFSGLLLTYGIEQVLILSTCNRSEVYVMYESDVSFLSSLYLNYFNQAMMPLYLKKGDEALAHLLKVACGLESMLIREDQILGQIKQAYDFTCKMNLGGKELYLIFQETLNFAKGIKKRYPQPSLSLTHLAVEYLKKFVSLNNQKIMICGAGEIALSFIPYLYEHNELIFSNRSDNKLMALKKQYSRIKIIPFKQRKIFLDQVDILISATSSPHLIFKANDFVNSRLIAVDLTIPRDIDKKALIKCINLDTLNQEIEKNNQLRSMGIENINKEIINKINEVKTKLDSIKYDYVIQSLQAKSMQLANQTYEILVNKLSLTARERHILEKTLKASFMQIMKDPIHCVKTNQINDIEVINKLFSLKEEKQK
ncbi:MAG: glutamyl-tRNA reductase [Thomasclavelia sp.]|uniref:glutamyl-tRNA reductase n=1 Tax=Thomasclavelia sp. TaxID=3025757 RepID=UPI0039A38ABD